jgi:hypothetical protein
VNRSLFLLAALTGCFDSIVDANRYALPDGTQEPMVDGAVDGSVPPDVAVVPPTDAGTPPDAPPCSLDLQSDPDNCGTCGHVCASGICELGHCVGELSGHIIAIGHDYQDHHAAMRRVLGNSISLAATNDVAVTRLRGTASHDSHAGTTAAINQSMSQLGRPWHNVPISQGLVDVDVLVIEAQTGDPAAARATGAVWAGPIDQLLQRGGIVIVLEGADGVSHELAAGANLFVTTPVVATGQHAFITDGSDAVAQQVVSPYLAETTSVTFGGLTGPIATLGGAVVVHQTRY